jgi:hypothetical protein
MMSGQISDFDRNIRRQQECVSQISHILSILKNISQNLISNLEVGTVQSSLHELEDVCRELILNWNGFCIIPLLYLIEPVFRSLRVLITLPHSCITISCSQFLSSFINYRFKLCSSIAAERIFSSIFDCSTLNIMIYNAREAFEPNCTATDQSQVMAISSTVCLLSDLLENGASDLYMSSSFIKLLFDLYFTILSKFNCEDDKHLAFALKCSSVFPLVLKLRSKADIVLSSCRMTTKISEDFVRDSRSRNLRIHAWAALGSEISPLLIGIFAECLLCKKDFLNDPNHQIDSASDLLSIVCSRPQFICASKRLERSSLAFQCVRLVIDALNRWRHQLASGCARSQVERLIKGWFDSDSSSFIIFLLLYCFDSSVVIRNQAISTLKEIGVFCPSLFSRPEDSQLIFDSLSTISDFCKCSKVIADANWLRALRHFDRNSSVVPRTCFSTV